MALCDSCHRNPVSILCYTDNAKLCYACDLSLHSMSFTRQHNRVWLCEVCTAAPAVVHCEMDAANMCTTCDELIHGSNILAAMHVRQPVELSKRYLAREGPPGGSVPATASLDPVGAPIAQPPSSDANAMSKRSASTANLVMVEGLNTFVAQKVNKVEIQDYRRQCEEVLKLNPEMFQHAANSMQPRTLVPPAQAEKILQNRETQSIRMPLPLMMEQADLRGLSDLKLAELQQGLAGGRTNLDSWAPANLNPMWKAPTNVESASAILREACNGLGEPDIVDQLLQGLGEQMQQATFMASTATVEQKGFGEQQQNKGTLYAGEDADMGGTEAAGPSDTFVMPASVLHVGNAQPLDREARVNRYREKRKNRKFQKTIRYASRAMYAGNRPRVKVIEELLFCWSIPSRILLSNSAWLQFS